MKDDYRLDREHGPGQGPREASDWANRKNSYGSLHWGPDRFKDRFRKGHLPPGLLNVFTSTFLYSFHGWGSCFFVFSLNLFLVFWNLFSSGGWVWIYAHISPVYSPLIWNTNYILPIGGLLLNFSFIPLICKSVPITLPHTIPTPIL